MRPKRKLKAIAEPAPDTRTVLTPAPGVIPVIKAEETARGAVDSFCATCGVILIEGVRPPTIRNMVIRCPQCGTYNETPQ